MTDNAKQEAWRGYCRKLEALGVDDPYAPGLPGSFLRCYNCLLHRAIGNSFREATGCY